MQTYNLLLHLLPETHMRRGLVLNRPEPSPPF
ncbi:hypothetical protein SFHH103_03822 [Sinorhizobium fredii HH103]|uniref:Uncharacterized protein n=1 Tax=Sinorhizobium fredii (strain HH103) TaxID=1117943 RepID=G9A603_SINF1|nr:hypothetical protein SFHH103_03822 [Sinorhizobium fredii HH103]